MKLCAGILYWGLKEELKTVELHGAGSQELTLSRPEFYLDRTKRLRGTASTFARPIICRHVRRSVQTCASSVWGSTGT